MIKRFFFNQPMRNDTILSVIVDLKHESDQSRSVMHSFESESLSKMRLMSLLSTLDVMKIMIFERFF